MQETTENITESTDVLANDAIENSTSETVQLSPEEQVFKDLQTKRMGKFKIGMGHGDAIYFRNLLDKCEYTGPQQAYLLIIAKSELSAVAEGLKNQDKLKRYEVELSSACIESLGFFMNNYKGKGADSATKLFTSSMLLRSAIGEINKLDEELAEARKNLKTEDK